MTALTERLARADQQLPTLIEYQTIVVLAQRAGTPLDWAAARAAIEPDCVLADLYRDQLDLVELVIELRGQPWDGAPFGYRALALGDRILHVCASAPTNDLLGESGNLADAVEALLDADVLQAAGLVAAAPLERAPSDLVLLRRSAHPAGRRRLSPTLGRGPNAAQAQ